MRKEFCNNIINLEYRFRGFNFTLNTTDYGNRTYGPNADIQTCCCVPKGVQKIEHRASNPLPTMTTLLSSHHIANEYQTNVNKSHG